MSTPLTREQFWACCDAQRHHDVQWTHREQVWKQIEDERATLRQQLATVTRERALFRASLYERAADLEAARNRVHMLKGQLATAQQHLEMQQTATYQAVAREHEAKQQLATVTRERDVLRQAMKNLADKYNSLSQQLTTARQEVWEEAAIYWDTMAEGPCKDGDDFAWACRVAQWCREQAKRETLP